MYKALGAPDFKKRFNLPENYTIGGFIAYGTHRAYPYELLKEVVGRKDTNTAFKNLEGFLAPILEFTVAGTKYWFVVVYGGVLLSEWLHVASLFGSKTNIMLGSCGGLRQEQNIGDLVFPTYVYADESITRAYADDKTCKYFPNEALRAELKESLATKYPIVEGPAITHQAMLGQTSADVQRWSKEGYCAVEMESGVTFAVSNHFGIPSASILRIGDNLIKEESVFHIDFEKPKGMEKQIDIRKQTARDMLQTAVGALLRHN